MSSERMDSSRMFGARQFLPLVAAALILVTGLLAWSPGLQGPYHFDDYNTPVGDPASQSLGDWRRYLSLTLRPLTKLTYALEAEAGWLNQPAPRRLVSILMLATSAALLGLLILQLESGAGAFLALLLAALWFIHPVHADSVLLLSGRSALLASGLLLAALLAMERFRPVVAATLFVLACLSRETALAGLLPLAVLVVSRPGTTPRQVVWQMAPVLAGAALVVCWILTTPRYLQLAEFSFLGRPFWQSFISQAGAVPVGLELLFRPAQLSIDYGVPLPARASDPLFLLGLGLYLAAATGTVLLLRRSRIAAVGLALWIAALLPTQSIIPKLDALSNRPLSLAMAGLLLAATPLLLPAFQRVPVAAKTTLAAGHAAWIAMVACAVLTLTGLLTGATLKRSELFQSELSLWRDAALKSRTNARPHMQYAGFLNRAGRKQEAWEEMLAAGAIDPFSSQIVAITKAFRPKEVVP